MKKKVLLILALLCALVQGAWADDGIHCSASDKGRVVCTDGSIYDNVSAAEADGKTAVAMIVYLDTKNNKGLALALADEGQMNWSTAMSTCSAKTPTVTGGTWKLASKYEWNDMIFGSYTALSDGFSSVGGTNMQSESDSYWSSTEGDSDHAWRYYYDFYGGMWVNDLKEHDDILVRAVLAFDFTVPVWPTQGAGTVDDPYIISSAEDWNDFAYNVRIGRSYSGQYVKLTSDISVSTMAGSYQADDNYQPFSGTFDGDGHTLTINLSNQSRFAAPFKCVNGATIKNLRTAGTINGTGNADGKLLAGLIGVSFGNTTISGCVSSVTLTTDFGEDAALAGLVAGTKGGSLTIEGCVFDGSMTGSSNTRCAGISGYEYTATNTTISYTLFTPKTLTVSTTDDSYTKTFSRDPDATITNCYYTQPLGAAQGTQAISTAQAPLGIGSEVQNYGFVKAYQNALLFGGMYYFGTATYTLTVKDGTEDAANWSADPNPAREGQSVAIKYNGTKKVKRVTAAKKAAAHPQAEGHALTAAALGEIVGSDGRAYAVADKDNLPTFVTAVAMVAYVGSETDHATYKHGLAIALSDEGKMNWSDAIRAYGHKAAFNGTAWMLPSKNQWKTMFRANGGNEESRAGLDTALAAAGGDSSKLQADDYWSGTEHERYPDNYAWDYYFDGGRWNYDPKDRSYCVRACLVF